MIQNPYMDKHGKLFASSVCRPRTAMVDTVPSGGAGMPFAVAASPKAKASRTMKTSKPKEMKVPKGVKVAKSLKRGRE